MTDGAADHPADPASQRYERCSHVVWRQGPDRVLVRRIGGEAFDLLGATALVWVALDDQRTVLQLIDELRDFGLDAAALRAALDDLVERGLLETSP